ncbi:hypothetical protein AB1Y20_023547 [Prymnesium parvum]|uniref:Delta-1-pyrroline-5-carboxylate synthase n=1 Tax=Prymnesium parvum TaxID=97485 RepID=A0AB34JH16_PRYPA
MRRDFASAKLVIIKVGTSCVTRDDGQLALGRVGALVEQIAQLVKHGKRVVLVSSGAIGIGAGKVSEQAVLSRSIRSHLQIRSQMEELAPSARAKAAAGQGGLMGLYDMLFSQYGLVCGQVLVTEGDFELASRRSNMKSTLEWMLRMGAVPVLNENDVLAAPERRRLFTDNDSLAVLVALELKAELLLLLSDVPGVFRAAPQPGDEPLRVVTRATQISYGSKSTRGRGGMEAKVEAALNAVERGVGAVIISSGLSPDNVGRIVRGDEIGTLFLRVGEADAEAADVESEAPQRQARAARAAARELQQLSHAERAALLFGLAEALEGGVEEIQAANALDLAAAARANMSEAMAARLKFPPRKVAAVADGVRALAQQPDPLGRTVRHMELAPGLVLRQETVPIGVLLIIFESRPDVLPQVASLAIASGNGLLLKGGKEAQHTNAVLHKIITSALERVSAGKVPAALIALVEGREEIKQLLKLHKEIDLCIPRGSNQMVQSIMNGTRIPTLGHADGICHVFIDRSADLGKAEKIAIDSKTDYPAACNALETLLLHEGLVASGAAERLLAALTNAGVALFGGPKAAAAFGLTPAATLSHEYGSLALTVELVADVHAAIAHINQYGSGHTDVVVAEDLQVAEAFMSRVDSADVFHNCSSRFADGFRFGLGAEVGISTSRIHARGPVGVEGLLTTRTRLVSDLAHTVSDFSKGNCKYTHRDLLARL